MGHSWCCQSNKQLETKGLEWAGAWDGQYPGRVQEPLGTWGRGLGGFKNLGGYKSLEGGRGLGVGGGSLTWA